MVVQDEDHSRVCGIGRDLLQINVADSAMAGSIHADGGLRTGGSDVQERAKRNMGVGSREQAARVGLYKRRRAAPEGRPPVVAKRKACNRAIRSSGVERHTRITAPLPICPYPL